MLTPNPGDWFPTLRISSMSSLVVSTENRRFHSMHGPPLNCKRFEVAPEWRRWGVHFVLEPIPLCNGSAAVASKGLVRDSQSCETQDAPGEWALQTAQLE